jgi:hypothetical protein
MRPFALALLTSTLLAGCATTRVLALHEFSPSTTATPRDALQGLTYAIDITSSANLMDPAARGQVGVTGPADGFAFREMTEDEKAQWREMTEAAKAHQTKADWTSIGWMRNGFGMHMADIYATIPPRRFLTETLAMEIADHGGRVVDDAAAADVKIEGRIRYFKVDIYMKYWADLVVDWRLTPRGGHPTDLALHTTAQRTAMSSSSFEFYQPVRACEQDMMWQVVDAVKDLRP